ncbi:unnamed protein product, partial [Symbiodinium sp. CCMP2456]
ATMTIEEEVQTALEAEERLEASEEAAAEAYARAEVRCREQQQAENSQLTELQAQQHLETCEMQEMVQCLDDTEGRELILNLELRALQEKATEEAELKEDLAAAEFEQ